MKKIILSLASLTALVGQAFAAGVLLNGNQINPQTAISISTLTVTGTTGITVTAGGFYGAGTGLTGTAASLTAGTATNWNGGAVPNVTTFASSVTVNSSMTVIDSAAGDTYALIVATGTAASQQIVTVSTTGAFNVTGYTGSQNEAASYVGSISSSTSVSNISIGASGSYVALATVTVSAGWWQLTGGCTIIGGATTAANSIWCGISNSASAFDSSMPDATTFLGNAAAGGVTCGATCEYVMSAGAGRYVYASAPTTYYIVGYLTYTTLGGAYWYGTGARLTALRFR